MKIFNTLTGRKEEFVPLEPGKVKMYVSHPPAGHFPDRPTDSCTENSVPSPGTL